MVSSEKINLTIEALAAEGINPYETYDGAAPIIGTYEVSDVSTNGTV